MKKNGKKLLISGTALLVMFAIWTWLIQCVDVQSAGQKGTEIGFATFNCWFHRVTGVNMVIYTITDWLGLVPIFVCMAFGGVGVAQLIKRKSLFKVDRDLILLGIYYVIVILAYLIFEMIPINYRPILIDGMLEASYIYNQIPYKMKDGCVYPEGLPKVLQEYGLCAKYYSGNLKTLQNEVGKGMPVIVMIRVRTDKNWLHYVPVVGFDDRYVFVAESLPELVNCNCKYYNRRIEKKYFLQLWNTAMLKQPLFRNTFYVVTKYDIKKGE